MRTTIAGLAPGLMLLSGAAVGDENFNRIATFANYKNAGMGIETVSEIVAATADGMTLVYTDAASEAVGFVDISDPAAPSAIGTLGMPGEPTSVDILGNHYALVAVNTSTDFVDTSGELVVVHIASQTIVDSIDLPGQPDSLKISPDENYAAIAIENERDEDLGDGELPQLPAGSLVIVKLSNAWNTRSWNVRNVALTGLSGCTYAPEDPEAEFVDINDDNIAVVTMQENNCLALVNVQNHKVIGSFDAGAVSLDKVDLTEDGVISLTESTPAPLPREPDAVAWVKGNGRPTIATANEGDLFGGSRGFSIFSQTGKVLYDSGNSYEHLAVRNGHYPEDRSENKGSEPESVAFGSYGSEDYLFVGSERGSFVAVYRINNAGLPVFAQILPAPLGPEGLLPIPGRGLLLASGEEDDPTFGVRSTIMIYELQHESADYPHILSANDNAGAPIPWSAMSGMSASAGNNLLAVQDSYYSEPNIYTIDSAVTPALITHADPIVGNVLFPVLDPEGITVAPDGSYWIASEGNASDSRPNALLQTTPDGIVLQEVGLPAEILACRDASTGGTLGSGFEGVAAYGSANDYVLLVAQQRGWNYTTPACEDLDDDPVDADDSEPGFTRIWIYDPHVGQWDMDATITYELAPVPANAAWMGLSEITIVDDYAILIERDNRTGDWAEYKTLVKISIDDLMDGDGVTAGEKAIFDLLPVMRSTNGWISDKPEGVAVDGNGTLFIITDNDGVEDWSGETQFFDLGDYHELFSDD